MARARSGPGTRRVGVSNFFGVCVGSLLPFSVVLSRTNTWGARDKLRNLSVPCLVGFAQRFSCFWKPYLPGTKRNIIPANIDGAQSRNKYDKRRICLFFSRECIFEFRYGARSRTTRDHWVPRLYGDNNGIDFVAPWRSKRIDEQRNGNEDEAARTERSNERSVKLLLRNVRAREREKKKKGGSTYARIKANREIQRNGWKCIRERAKIITGYGRIFG